MFWDKNVKYCPIVKQVAEESSKKYSLACGLGRNRWNRKIYTKLVYILWGYFCSGVSNISQQGIITHSRRFWSSGGSWFHQKNEPSAIDKASFIFFGPLFHVGKPIFEP
jgi:hypothetical protein